MPTLQSAISWPDVGGALVSSFHDELVRRAIPDPRFNATPQHAEGEDEADFERLETFLIKAGFDQLGSPIVIGSKLLVSEPERFVRQH